MTNIDKTSDTELSGMRQALLGALTIFLVALIYRVFIVFTENLPWQFFHLAIHGALADMAIPFAIAAIGLYAGKPAVITLSCWAGYFTAFLICCDAFHFGKFQMRVNTDFLTESMLSQCSLQEKAGLAAALILAWLTLWLISHLAGKRAFSESRAKTSLILFTAMLLMAGKATESGLPVLPQTLAWDQFSSQTSSLRRSFLHLSSFNCIFSLSVYDQLTYPSALFIESQYCGEYQKRFADQAQQAAKDCSQLPVSKTWLHMQNSAVDAEKAFNSGIQGIEIDIHYDQAQERIVVCHDFPPLNITADKLQTLEAFFASPGINSGNGQFFWLDFKNINYKNCDDAIACLKKALSKVNQVDRIFVESRNQFMVRRLSQSGIKSIWGLYYGDKTAKLEMEAIPAIKAFAALSQCSLISLPWQAFDRTAIEQLAPLPVAVYTVNDSNDIQRFLLENQIKIILTDPLAKPGSSK